MPPAVPLSPRALARYSRHVRLPEIGVEGQARISAGRVLVVGLGGLGSPAALYLAAAGVGTLGLVDFDNVEEHNLQRQVIHGTSTIGAPKIRSAAARLADLNPLVDLRLHEQAVDAHNAQALFEAYDVIVDGTDNFATRFLNNDAAVLARRPLVYGSVLRFEGQVSVFAPHLGAPCYRCLFPSPPPPGSVPNCAEAGVFGALCGTIGSLQAMEAIKLLAGVGEPLLGRLLVVDALAAAVRSVRVKRDPACPVCGAAPSITSLEPGRYTATCAPQEPPPSSTMDDTPLEIDVNEAARLLRAGATLLDVREPFETDICKVDGARTIPMRQVPARLAEIPQDARVLVLCHHGSRSLRVTHFLRQQGYAHASNVAGGIDAWAQQVEPSLARY